MLFPETRLFMSEIRAMRWFLASRPCLSPSTIHYVPDELGLPLIASLLRGVSSALHYGIVFHGKS